MEGSVAFRASRRPYLAVSVLAGFFLFIGTVLVFENRGAWPVLAFIGAVALYWVGSTAYLRLDVTPTGIRYRTVRGTRTVAFGDIERAYFEAVANRAAPHGLYGFCIKPKQVKLLRLDLRALRAGAAPRLLTALERRGITVERPEKPAAPQGHSGFWR